MKEEEEKLRRRKFAERCANPKNKSTHIKCSRCGKLMYAPMPCRYDIEGWGAHTFAILTITYLNKKGWKAVKVGDFNADYVCPNCITDKDNDCYKSTESGLSAIGKYENWVDKMREKYNYYEK